MSTEKAHFVCDIPLEGTGFSIDDALANLACKLRRDHPGSLGSISTVQFDWVDHSTMASPGRSTRVWTARATLHTTREVDL